MNYLSSLSMVGLSIKRRIIVISCLMLAGLSGFLQVVNQWSEVAQSFLTLCDPMDCNLPGSSIHGVFQARVLEWVGIAFSDRRMLNSLNYSLLSRISPGGILGQSRLFILLIYSLSIVFIDHECYFHFFFCLFVLVSSVRTVLYPVEGKGSIMYQEPR